MKKLIWPTIVSFLVATSMTEARAQTTTVTVRARADLLKEKDGTQGPIMEVRANDSTIGRVEVKSKTFQDFVFPGVKRDARVDVIFINDLSRAVALPVATYCAAEGKFCNFKGTKQVQYRANNKSITKTFTNGTACTTAIFGEPLVNTGKVCEILGSLPPGKRKLYVESITIGTKKTPSTSPGVVFDRGVGTLAFDGVNTMPGRQDLEWSGALRFPAAPRTFLGYGSMEELNAILRSDASLGFTTRIRDGQFTEVVTQFRVTSGVLEYYTGSAWLSPSTEAILQSPSSAK
jgi:hypothetical protein